MGTITFDTHQLVKELKAKGFSDDQAEGINDALKNALTVAEVATRRDLNRVVFLAGFFVIRSWPWLNRPPEQGSSGTRF